MVILQESHRVTYSSNMKRDITNTGNVPDNENESTDNRQHLRVHDLTDGGYPSLPKESATECFYCGEISNQECQHCEGVFFCCQEHYNHHHQDSYCHPFVLKRDPLVGRFMVASRDIRPCELILSEKPAVAGPYIRTRPVCLQCFTKVDGSFRCPDCNFPMCNLLCSFGEMHQLECQYFVSKQFKLASKPLESADSNYSCISILRMLLKKDYDPKTYRKINLLMDHKKERSCDAIDVTTVKLLMNVTDFLKRVNADTSDNPEFSESEIERMIAILRTNGMTLELDSQVQNMGVVLYPTYCLINHSCCNNTNYHKFQDLHIELRSQVKIKKGEEIFTRYISPTLGNSKRKQDISKYWFFSCHCRRCQDVTEFGTHMSSVRCTGCPDKEAGLVTPTDTQDYDKDWECCKCGQHFGGQKIIDQVDSIEKELARVDMKDINLLEELIHWHTNHSLLHQKHYLVLDLMHFLALAYSAQPLLTRPQQERKIQLCSHVLKVLGRVDLGYAQWKSKLLKEMASSLLLLTKADNSSGSIPSWLFKRRLYSCMVSLARARKCQQAGFSTCATKKYVVFNKSG